MNQEHFTSRYTQLGIELQALAYQASMQMSTELYNNVSTSEETDSEVSVAKDDVNILNSVQMFQIVDIQKNMGLKI